MSNSVGSRLKTRRKELNLTQKEVGVKSMISEFTVSKYERDYSSPDVETLKRLSDALDCTSDYLIGKADQPKTRFYSYEDEELGTIEVGINDYPMELTPEEVKEMMETLKKYHFDVEALINDMRDKKD